MHQMSVDGLLRDSRSRLAASSHVQVACELVQDVERRRPPHKLHAANDLIHALVERTRAITGQIDQVLVVVLDLRAAARQVAGHGAIRFAQGWIEGPGQRISQISVVKDAIDRARVQWSYLAEWNASTAQDRVILQEQIEEEPASLWNPQEA